MSQVEASDGRAPDIALDAADDEEKAELVSVRNNLRAYIAGDGSWALEKADDPTAFRADFSLDGAIGEDGPILAASGVSVSGNSIEQRWDNTPRGVEHTMIIATPPDDTGVLTLTMHVAGLTPSLESDRTISLVAEDGTKIAYYRDLLAYDADGADLPSFLSVDEDAIVIVTDTSTAAWPVTIDPIVTTAVTRSGAAATECFGRSFGVGHLNTDVFADVVVGIPCRAAGANMLAGGFRVFLNSSSGIASAPTTSLERDGSVSFGEFGDTIAVGDVDGDGFDDIVAAAPGESSAGHSENAPFSWTHKAATTRCRSVGCQGEYAGRLRMNLGPKPWSSC